MTLHAVVHAGRAASIGSARVSTVAKAQIAARIVDEELRVDDVSMQVSLTHVP